MNILHINGTYKTGSTGRLSYEISESMRLKGHNCKCIYALESYDDKFSIKIGSNLDRKIHALLSRLLGLQGYFSYFSTKKILNRIEEFTPDIVHLHNLHSNYINIKLLLNYLSKNKIATVITLHDCWFFTGKCTHFCPADCYKWKETCGECPLLHIDNVNPTLFFDRTKKCLEDKKIMINDIEKISIVGVSDWISNQARESILKDKYIETIYNWVDLDIFKYRESDLRQKLKLTDKKILLMVSSNISKVKGYDVMVELASKLPSEYQLIIIGKNKFNLYIPSNVIHIEHTNNQVELSEFYSLADICINTTQYETFGMVTVESMACGTPVIVYNNSASPEIIDSYSGVVVEEKNGIEAIIDAIYKINSIDEKEMSRHCINRVSEMFNKEKNTDKYLQLYERLNMNEK